MGGYHAGTSSGPYGGSGVGGSGPRDKTDGYGKDGAKPGKDKVSIAGNDSAITGVNAHKLSEQYGVDIRIAIDYLANGSLNKSIEAGLAKDAVISASKALVGAAFSPNSYIGELANGLISEVGNQVVEMNDSGLAEVKASLAEFSSMADALVSGSISVNDLFAELGLKSSVANMTAQEARVAKLTVKGFGSLLGATGNLFGGLVSYKGALEEGYTPEQALDIAVASTAVGVLGGAAAGAAVGGAIGLAGFGVSAIPGAVMGALAGGIAGLAGSSYAEGVAKKAVGKPGLPIVLDLSGSGINLTEQDNSNQYYDLAGTGYQQRTAWASVGNGVLAIDADGDGAITERKEIVFTDWDPNAEDDMAALRSVFDTDNDGFLTSADARFGDFRLVVTNADGTTTVKTLTELGITSIKLTTDSTSYTLPDGSSIDGMTTFTRMVDGVETIGKAAAVTLAADAQGYAIDSETKINLDNSTTITNKARNADGSLASVTITTTSEDGLARTISFDNNGDGVVDRIQSWTKIAHMDGSKTEIVTNKNGGGVLLDRTETTTSADGNTIAIARDTRGGGYFTEEESRVFGQGGGLTITLTKLNPDGSTINSKTITTTSDGLTRIESYDLDGNGSADLIVKDETMINNDQSRIETVTRTSGNGTLLDRTVTEIDPTGQNRTITTDADGDGDVDSITSVNVVDYQNESQFALPNGSLIAVPANSAVTTETIRNGYRKAA